MSLLVFKIEVGHIDLICGFVAAECGNRMFAYRNILYNIQSDGNIHNYTKPITKLNLYYERDTSMGS
jgi:hypothetical protein